MIYSVTLYNPYLEERYSIKRSHFKWILWLWCLYYNCIENGKLICWWCADTKMTIEPFNNDMIIRKVNFEDGYIIG